MTATAVILEIRDGLAVGPLHEPAAEAGGGGAVSAVLFKDVEPLWWPTLCGVRGYVYQRAGVVKCEPSLRDCPECLVAAPAEAERQARRQERLDRKRQGWRESKRRRRGIETPSPRPCEECGDEFVPSKYARRTGRRFCSRACSSVSYWRAKQQARRAAA